jgi:hypothetical protein
MPAPHVLFIISLFSRVETREEKKERRKREKAEQVAYKLEQVGIILIIPLLSYSSIYTCYFSFGSN